MYLKSNNLKCLVEYFMKKSIILLFFFYSIGLVGQNFLANPSFEEFNKCEEFGSKCAPEAWFRIPPEDLTVSSKVKKRPHKGKISEILVIENTKHPLSRRVFIYTKILCPLVKGNKYKLSFFLNNLDRKHYKVEALFSEEELIAGVQNPLNFKPSLIFTLEQETRNFEGEEWKKVASTYTATGEEKFLTLGYFSKKEFRVSPEEVSNSKGDVIILVDDIELKPLDPTEQICSEFEMEKLNLFSQNYRHTLKISVDSVPKVATFVTPEWKNNFFESPKEEEAEEKEIEEKPTIVFKNRTWCEKDTIVFEIPFVAFDFDQIQIKDKFKSRLDSFAMQIEYLNPEKIQYIGHTDSMGAAIYNQKLSTSRAKSVQKYLKRFDYFKNAKEEIIGKGESSPKADNKTLEGRQLNRRVEIVIFKKKKT